MKDLINEDWEMEFSKNLVYLQEDIEELRVRGIKYLITTTPEFEGRSFGTNVLEAMLLAMIGKKWEEIVAEDYLGLIGKLGLRPRIERLNSTQEHN